MMKDTIAVNLNNSAHARFTGFAFNSFFELDGKRYGTNALGVFLLEGELDYGAQEIPASVTTPAADFGAPARNDPLVLVWRKQVLSRDGYKCVKCGSKKEIQAHHIVRWVDMPEARLLPENGMTLCRVCHVNVHGHGAAA